MPTSVPIDPSTVHAFSDRMRGPVVLPDDPDYEEARQIWNGRIDRRPNIIARCTGAADVRSAVNFAREQDLLLSVKGGGHSYAGNAACDDGLMIDLSLMMGVRVDPEGQTARVEPGVTWGQFDHETQAFGLATTGATVSTVGVAGYTLGGGTGYLARQLGLSVDNLSSVDVVTAKGELVHASENEHSELFWALRGGSGNFGVVTSFEFQLHEVDSEVLFGQIVHPLEEADDMLRFYRDFMADAPDELQCYPFLLQVPPLDTFPEPYHGDVVLDLVVCYAGDVSEGESVLQPLRNAGDCILDAVQPASYLAVQQSFDDGLPKGERYYSKSHSLSELSDEVIATVLDHAESLAGPYTVAYFEPIGGAINRVDPASTAFPHRDAAYNFHVLAGWSDPERDEEIMSWTRAYHEALRPHATGGVYVNLLGEDEGDRVTAAYGDHYTRLAQIKSKWDPENLFRRNHNIEPTP